MDSLAKHRVEQQLAATWPPDNWRDVTSLVAVSGGADSVALLRAAAAVRRSGRGRLLAVHFDHRLRSGAAEDARFVRSLGEQLGVEVHLGAAETAHGAADEASARRARYAFFRQAVNQLGARFLVTAHTRDDQVETVLHRVIRGTGIEGLAGIPRVRELTTGCCLLRPLLEVSRRELREYLDRLRQPYREDPTNQQLRYTRNRLRHELLPELAATYNPRVDQALLRLASLAEECQAVVDERVRELTERYVGTAGDAVRLPVAGLAQAPPYVVRQLLVAIWKRRQWPRQGMAYEHWDQLAAMLRPDAPPPRRRHFPGRIRAERGDDFLELKPDPAILNHHPPRREKPNS